MITGSYGDRAQAYALRNQNTSIKVEMNRLTKELATGQVSEVRKVLKGNYSYLTDIERKLTTIENYQIATAEAAQFTSVLQNTLGKFDTVTKDLSSALLSAGSVAGAAGTAAVEVEARIALESIVGGLNDSVAGRQLFSGTATNQPSLPAADDILNALRTVVAGAGTPTDIMNAAQTWFDDPAGYQATLYQGSVDALAPFTLSQSDKVTVDITAMAPELRDLVRLAAISALAVDPALGLGPGDQIELFELAGEESLSAQGDLIKLRSEVGFAENRIETVTARNAAETTSLNYAKAALLDIDPFEAATKLEEVQFQLQTLYSVTVRSSQLSLVNFL